MGLPQPVVPLQLVNAPHPMGSPQPVCSLQRMGSPQPMGPPPPQPHGSTVDHGRPNTCACVKTTIKTTNSIDTFSRCHRLERVPMVCEPGPPKADHGPGRRKPKEPGPLSDDAISMYTLSSTTDASQSRTSDTPTAPATQVDVVAPSVAHLS